MAISSGLLFLSYTLLAIPFLTWFVTSYRFHQATSGSERNHKNDDEKVAPTVPYRIPFMGDAILAFLNPEKYVSGIL